MTTKERIKQTMENWKFPVLQETDNSIVFRYQMNYIQANVTGSEGSSAIVLTLSGIFKADDDKEMLRAMRTCNELNCQLLQAKLYIDPDSDLIIASEFFYDEPGDFERILNLSLQGLVIAKKRFIQKYKELEDEAKLISELEQE